LFGGPLFTVYKVLSIIQLADRLRQAHPEYHFVPLFWIHTEDHDFDEINHYYDAFDSVHRYAADVTGPVGRHVLTEEIRKVIPPHLEARFTRWYAPGNTMAEAFRGFMNEIFGEYGLVILDPDHAGLKRRFRDVMARELTDNLSHDLVAGTSDRLKEAGYDVQINPREINLFYLEDAGRNRIVANNGSFQVLHTDHRFDQQRLLDTVRDHPEYFSPNVSLRPLYQEVILPNLAYVGGWAEIAYWLQLKDVFDHYGVNFPLLLPRMMATVFRASELDAWQHLGFEAADIRKPLHELFRQFMPRVWDAQPLNEIAAKLLDDFGQLEQYIGQFSDTLPRSVVGQQVQTEKFLDNLEKKLHRVLRQLHAQPFREIESLTAAIYPEGKVQERVLSLAAFPELSPGEFVARVYPLVDVLNTEHCYIRLANL
jgi:bacillithiol biosynthesis cysteine-adding enzyme BshC